MLTTFCPYISFCLRPFPSRWLLFFLCCFTSLMQSFIHPPLLLTPPQNDMVLSLLDTPRLFESPLPLCSIFVNQGHPFFLRSLFFLPFFLAFPSASLSFSFQVPSSVHSPRCLQFRSLSATFPVGL